MRLLATSRNCWYINWPNILCLELLSAIRFYDGIGHRRMGPRFRRLKRARLNAATHPHYAAVVVHTRLDNFRYYVFDYQEFLDLMKFVHNWYHYGKELNEKIILITIIELCSLFVVFHFPILCLQVIQKLFKHNIITKCHSPNIN